MFKNKKTPNIIDINDNISFPIGTAVAVQNYSSKLDFKNLFFEHKKRGIDITKLIEALLTYKLSYNQSICKASLWINKPEILEFFSLKQFEERTLFRCFETLGENFEEILCKLRSTIFKTYTFPHTNVNLDWTNFILWGLNAELGEFGYSKQHRHDKKQVNIGIAEISAPVNIPIGLTVHAGNMNDQIHFKHTFNQIKESLKPESRIVFDKGAQSKENEELILASKLNYVSAKKLNLSDDKRIKYFDTKTAELIDPISNVYGLKIVYPSRIDYLFFSEQLKADQIAARKRAALKKLAEAKEIQNSLKTKRGLPKKYQIRNPLVDVTYSYQTKLVELDDEQALRELERDSITGREGFFCLVSSQNLTLSEVLAIYRSKDSLEKIFQSLKNDLDIKPLRVWSEKSMKGALLLGFITQLIISLMRYDYSKLKHIAPKFIKSSLMNLTVTIEKLNSTKNRYIYSNFDEINTMFFTQNQGIT